MAVTRKGRSDNLHEDDLFIFVHVPKTAGSTFRDVLARQFAPNETFRIGTDFQAGIRRIQALPPGEKARIRCVSGHVPYGVHRCFEGRRPRYVSFVRDPVDRTLSEYFFLLKRPQLLPLIGLAPDTPLTIDAFLERHEALGMQDFQARCLTGFDDMVESCLPPYRLMTVTNVEQLIRDIEAAYDLLGTVERFDESLLLIKDRFGWGNTCYVSRHVAHPSSHRQELRQTLTERIRRMNPLDCRLHAHFRRRIEEQAQEQGEAFLARLHRFRLLNRAYSCAWRACRGTGLRQLYRSFARRRAACQRLGAAPVAQIRVQ